MLYSQSKWIYIFSLRRSNPSIVFTFSGPGASAKIISPTRDIGNSIVRRLIDSGSYGATKIDDLHQRIITPLQLNLNPLDAMLAMHIEPGPLRALVLKELSPSEEIASVFQYQIFSFCCKPSVIFTLNVDGLAKRFCPGHIVIDAHGSIDLRITRSVFWEQYINWLLYYGYSMRLNPGEIIFPGPEPLDVTMRNSYERAEILFRFAKYVVFIGYSFGRFGEHIDDTETFEFFRYLLRKYPMPVIVILSPRKLMKKQ